MPLQNYTNGGTMSFTSTPYKSLSDLQKELDIKRKEVASAEAAYRTKQLAEQLYATGKEICWDKLTANLIHFSDETETHRDQLIANFANQFKLDMKPKEIQTLFFTCCRRTHDCIISDIETYQQCADDIQGKVLEKKIEDIK